MKSYLKIKNAKAMVILLTTMFCLVTQGHSQEIYLAKSKSSLSTLDNQTIKVSDIIKSDNTIVAFIESYNEDHASYIQKLIDEKGKGSFPKNTEIIAVCYDNSGTFKHIKPLIKKKNWNIRVLMDKERKLVNYDYLYQRSLLSSSFNTKPSILTLIFEDNRLISQFYSNKSKVDASFFGKRYGSVILN
ncbi:hypothetical protein [Flagellimonas sp.]|uniref:hypothetical protein n=1 Tax=Flagellimonas sp. TaxID=2058762 RepID=UPI003B504E0B